VPLLFSLKPVVNNYYIISKLLEKKEKKDNTASLEAKRRRERKLPEIRMKGLRKNHFSFLKKTIIS
jgi:hypothetical protein